MKSVFKFFKSDLKPMDLFGSYSKRVTPLVRAQLSWAGVVRIPQKRCHICDPPFSWLENDRCAGVYLALVVRNKVQTSVRIEKLCSYNCNDFSEFVFLDLSPYYLNTVDTRRKCMHFKSTCLNTCNILSWFPFSIQITWCLFNSYFHPHRCLLSN